MVVLERDGLGEDAVDEGALDEGIFGAVSKEEEGVLVGYGGDTVSV